MDGVTYFGSESINLNEWVDQPKIFNAIELIKNRFLEIGESCKYIRIEVPYDWHEIKLDGKSFWEKLCDVCKDSDIVGYVAKELFDKVFNQRINKSKTIVEAINDVVNNNPDLTNMKYFSVLSFGGKWHSISGHYHVENKEQLYRYAINFLQNHPVNEQCFASRSTSIFSNIIFHDNFCNTLTGHGEVSKHSKYGKALITGINGFSQSVTTTLKILHEINLQGKETKGILSEIQALSKFECSPEGGKSEHLNFDFQNTEPKKLNCEFHVKIHRNNTNDGVYYQDRLYFGFFTENEQRKIAVAHSGKHL